MLEGSWFESCPRYLPRPNAYALGFFLFYARNTCIGLIRRVPKIDNYLHLILIHLDVTHLRVKMGVFGRAPPAQKPPFSYQLRESYH